MFNISENDQNTAVHSALHPPKGISPDVFPAAFDWFFSFNIFVRWVQTRTSWQLHCVGGPGAGKSTLTSLICRHLGEDEHTKRYPVVGIHIHRHVRNHEMGFVEDLLWTIYQELGKSDLLEDDKSHDICNEYTTGRFAGPDAPEGLRFKDRLSLLREILALRLEALQNARAFLLVDGVDRCSQTIRLMVDAELDLLLKKGLSVLTTSRLPVFEQGRFLCEHPDDATPEWERQDLDMCWECSECPANLCFPCRDAGRLCPSCHQDTHLREPYDHLTIWVAVPEPAMRKYIAWNLEREHGDLGLRSTCRKPPLSALGTALKSTGRAQKHADEVYDSALDHIGFAKARLDLIHSTGTLEGIEARRDALPTNIVSMFDAGLKNIEKQPKWQREIALRSIARVSLHGAQGVEIPVLRAQLNHPDPVETRSGEDILEATQGFLTGTIGDAVQKVIVFNATFFYYIAQRYNKSIHRASLDVRPPRPRFEPQNIPESPAVVLPSKLNRSSTLDIVHEEPAITMLKRKGTRVWQ